MKSAREMFEKIGYECVDEERIVYKKYDDSIKRIIHIAFFDNKKILITQSIGLEELQAINKQAKELHWKVD